MEQNSNLSDHADRRSPVDELAAQRRDESNSAGASWLRSLDRVDADLFVLHRCVEVPLEEAATWVGVSVDAAHEALARCDQHLSSLTA